MKCGGRTILVGQNAQEVTTMGYGNCCGPGFTGRRYLTKDEKLDWLNNYAKELESELQGVKERLKEIKKE